MPTSPLDGLGPLQEEINRLSAEISRNIMLSGGTTVPNVYIDEAHRFPTNYTVTIGSDGIYERTSYAPAYADGTANFSNTGALFDIPTSSYMDWSKPYNKEKVLWDTIQDALVTKGLARQEYPFAAL